MGLATADSRDFAPLKPTQQVKRTDLVMNPFAKKYMLTVEAILYITLQNDDEPIKMAETLAARGISPRHLEPIFQRLARAGILLSRRGIKGGYVLGRDRKSISLADILEASSDGGTQSTQKKRTYRAKPVIEIVLEELEAKWTDDLATISLDDLLKRAAMIEDGSPKS